MSARGVAEALREAEQRGLVGDVDSAVILYDLDVLERQVRRVRTSFPDDAWHAVAIKSNPLICVLRAMADMNVFAEAASAEEMAVARAAGFGKRIVWDSPAKTFAEIRAALADPPDLINVDSFAELDRYPSGDVRLGLRINPERRPDTISALATGVAGSKFGVPISQRERIHDAYAAESRLTAIHVHSGSNSRSLEPMVDAVDAVVGLADEINARPATKQRVDTVDIGGGLPYTEDPNDTLSVERYAARLAERVPRLFDGTYRIVTEFGRFHHLGAGSTASRVEYVTTSPERTHAVIHVGADAFVREVYDPAHWQVTFADDADDAESADDGRGFDVVGPLCFEGDVVARSVGRSIPEPGEWLVAERTGANTFALWSRHCSRAFPAVLLYRSSDVASTLRVGKPRESPDDVIAFWS